MKKIDFYYVYFAPGGSGHVVLRLNGDTNNTVISPLTASDFAAVAAVLSLKRISYDPVKRLFASYDDDDASPAFVRDLNL